MTRAGCRPRKARSRNYSNDTFSCRTEHERRDLSFCDYIIPHLSSLISLLLSSFVHRPSSFVFRTSYLIPPPSSLFQFCPFPLCNSCFAFIWIYDRTVGSV